MQPGNRLDHEAERFVLSGADEIDHVRSSLLELEGRRGNELFTSAGKSHGNLMGRNGQIRFSLVTAGDLGEQRLAVRQDIDRGRRRLVAHHKARLPRRNLGQVVLEYAQRRTPALVEVRNDRDVQTSIEVDHILKSGLGIWRGTHVSDGDVVLPFRERERVCSALGLEAAEQKLPIHVHVGSESRKAVDDCHAAIDLCLGEPLTGWHHNNEKQGEQRKKLPHGHHLRWWLSRRRPPNNVCPPGTSYGQYTNETVAARGRLTGSRGSSGSVGQHKRYRLYHRIAEDNTGSLWEAMDTALGKPVTVKVFSDSLSSDPRFVNGFRRELRAAFPLLEHPGVAQVINYNYGEDGPQQFVVMEPVQGETAAQRLHREGPFQPDEALRIAVEVGEALRAAHRLDLVHGGVTPHNVMITPSGEVKLLDFGVAKVPVPMESADGQGGFRLPPERAAGAEVGPASDVYSLADFLYQMLVGQPPPEAGATLEGLGPRVGNSLVQICERALDRNQDSRPSLSAFSSALKRAQQQVQGRDAEPREAETLEAERAEAERAEAERQAAARLAERAEAARLEAERLERERLEAERLEAERAAAARLAAERATPTVSRRAARRELKEEKNRIKAAEREAREAARQEAARLEAAKREAERERAESERLEKARAEAARKEAERLEKARQEEAPKTAKREVREEKSRLKAARRQEQEAARVEAERAEEARRAAEREEAERAEAARLEADRAEAARKDAERLEAERREAERIQAERAEKTRKDAARRDATKQKGSRRAARQERREEKARLKAARRHEQEAARAEADRAAAAQKEAERVEAERLEAVREEAARKEAERKEAEREEAARLKAEREEAAKREAAREHAERQAERLEKARQEEEARNNKARLKAAKRLERMAARQQSARLEAVRQDRERQEAARREALRLREAREIEAPEAEPGGEQEADKKLRRRVIGTLVGGTVVVVGLALVILMQNLQRDPETRASSRVATPAASPAASLPASPPSVSPPAPSPPPASEGTVAVPNLSGLTAVEARAALLEAGLNYDGNIPTPGPAGVVMRSDPASGERVAEGTAVKIYIGAESDRLLEEQAPQG